MNPINDEPMEWNDSIFSCSSCLSTGRHQITCPSCYKSWCVKCVGAKIRLRGNTTCIFCFEPLTIRELGDANGKLIDELEPLVSACGSFWARTENRLYNKFTNSEYRLMRTCCGAFLNTPSCPKCTRNPDDMFRRKTEARGFSSDNYKNCPNCLTILTATRPVLKCPLCLITFCKATGAFVCSNYCLLQGTLLRDDRSNLVDLFRPITSPVVHMVYKLKQTILTHQECLLRQNYSSRSFSDWSVVYTLGKLYTRLFSDNDVAEKLANLCCDSSSTLYSTTTTTTATVWFDVLIANFEKQHVLREALQLFFSHVRQEHVNAAADTLEPYANLQNLFETLCRNTYSNVPSIDLFCREFDNIVAQTKIEML